MPSALELDFLRHTLEMEEKKHQRWNYQVGGLYAIGTPESEFFRPIHHKPRGYKIGKSLHILRRLNEYTLVCPWDNPALKVHCVLLMPHTTKTDQAKIDAAERQVLSALKKKHPNPGNWPGISEGTRSFFTRSEWIQDVPLQEVEAEIKKCEGPNDLFLRCDASTNVPKEWYAFKHRQDQQKAVERVRRQEVKQAPEVQARKRRCDEIYAPPKFKPRWSYLDIT